MGHRDHPIADFGQFMGLELANERTGPHFGPIKSGLLILIVCPFENVGFISAHFTVLGPGHDVPPHSGLRSVTG